MSHRARSVHEQEEAWRWVEPILEHWKGELQGPRPYAAGTWGPSAAGAMIARDGFVGLKNVKPVASTDKGNFPPGRRKETKFGVSQN
ncbi:MAG: hypothetical protein ACOYNZ_11575 [Rhodoferax sp.]